MQLLYWKVLLGFVKLTSMKTRKVQIALFDLNGFQSFLQSNLEGLFDGPIALSVSTENHIDFRDEPSPDLDMASSGTRFFLPFTSPDAEGGMAYGDGSQVHFDDPDILFSDADCIGYVLTRTENHWLIEQGLCSYCSIGPCCCHYHELVMEIPASKELVNRMDQALNQFIVS